MNSTFHFVIILLIVIGILFLTYAEKIQAKDATTLLGMIIGYLLGKGT